MNSVVGFKGIKGLGFRVAGLLWPRACSHKHVVGLPAALRIPAICSRHAAFDLSCHTFMPPLPLMPNWSFMCLLCDTTFPPQCSWECEWPWKGWCQCVVPVVGAFSHVCFMRQCTWALSMGCVTQAAHQSFTVHRPTSHITHHSQCRVPPHPCGTFGSRGPQHSAQAYGLPKRAHGD